ncbi:MAG: 50S ribosomal protein L16 [Oligoflexales bacterium]|nr:50S ribosomal protein L16 [Oligoflexales bacterium]
MLAPKKMKFRKQQKRRIRGQAQSGNHLAFGDFGLMSLEGGRITARQIEAARIAMTRKTKRGGQVWIKIFPDTPVSKKPAEVRMGKGKGSVDHYAAKVRPGRVLYEIGGIEKELAVEALQLAAAKLPVKTRLLVKNDDPWI